ncbi:hypothetical protein NQ315_011197 [Exocentrus adspersus]|uniref:Reverse transcriptase domain-containing protein n=1 Tax=Exocentrus adspersus TaxID=1586481 RepID=A0AAV8V6Y3_9CUCU|nr:hypothetical protein NQ315_011197 [Exocentrus adspersus]
MLRGYVDVASPWITMEFLKYKQYSILFYTLYINDLPLNIAGKLTIYADDSAVVISGSTTKELEVLISEAFENNLLILNLDKTEVVYFSKRGVVPSIVLPVVILSEHVKFLGSVIDTYSHLSYNIVIWGRAASVNRVFILQKRIIRLIFGIPPRQSCRDCFIRNKILTLPSIYTGCPAICGQSLGF